MKTIGFIGLGNMGKPMAKNLLENGVKTLVWNRTASVMDSLLEAGAKKGDSPAHVGEQADIVFLMLSNDAVVNEVLFGKQGLTTASFNKELVVINCSTVSTKTSKSIDNQFRELGLSYLEAPVTGSTVQAEEGTLNFLVGGDKETLEDCRPFLNMMGKNVFYIGEIETASTLKLASNSIVALNLLSLIEGLTIAKNANIDPELFLHILSQGGANSAILNAKTSKLIKEDFSPQFSVALMNKDLGLAKEIANDLGVPGLLLSQAKDLFLTSVNMGYGDNDVTAMLKCYENLLDPSAKNKEI